MTEPPAPPAFPGLSPDERRLVEALRARDEDGFTELIDRYQASLVRVAMMYVGSRAVAEDVVAETWLGVLRGIDGFEGRSAMRSWLYRIATNVCLDQLRGRQRRATPMDLGPAGTVETLVKPENKATLTKILTYHVVPGKLAESDLTDGKKLKTVEGEELTVKKADGKVMIIDAKGGSSTVTISNVNQSNGVIHVVDTVLMPAG